MNVGVAATGVAGVAATTGAITGMPDATVPDGGGATVAFALVQARFGAAPHAPAPGETLLAEEHWHGLADLGPSSVRPALEALQRALA